jgi:glycosyltransferase involved in cell wall biosynthesis
MGSNPNGRRLRILDYVANSGGGLRFVVELVGALASHRAVAIEFVSHGQALEDYRTLFSDRPDVRLVDVPPSNIRWIRGAHGFRGASRINSYLRLPQFHFDVPTGVCEDCDALWMPWLHRHRLTQAANSRVNVVGSLHDVIMLQQPGVVSPRLRRDEHETVRRWLDSGARIAVSSHATVRSLRELYGCDNERTRVIPVSGHHRRSRESGRRTPWPFDGSRYLLCPANTMPHKNHEVLFAGVRDAARTHPIVLIGGGTDLRTVCSPRAEQLLRSAEDAGLRWYGTLFGLGLVTDAEYYDLLDNAWALVMPTLAEGGGSFPVLEAMAAGIPTIVSDIPVLREMLDRTGGTVQWFDPTDPDSLASAIAELEAGYGDLKRAAVSQSGVVRLRSWDDVAADYADLLGLTTHAGSVGSTV